FEIDERLIKNLKEQFPHTAVICDDILKVDWGKELNENIKIVSNLPYQITSPFLFKVAKFAEKIDKTVVMIQREVADRIVAKPGTKNYGILSLKLQYFFDIKYLFGVKRHLFIPVPNVDSAVISLTSRSDKPEIENLKLFWKIVELSFRNRRKMLRKNLRQIIANDKIPEIAKDSKIDLKRRGESLSEEEFIILYRSVKSFL
ncbi:MAG: 16S rRNA (adenine(1518)-N(6)/adenine(1519)-N(6))-dimethyltransferase RsmA, partial [Candidatus Cloacimonadota bacterium]|nr:16S rRNA (adenine(1518)-N(6)/adenine(1519)-N(6))-dimethyltransferase RsmA [Candidatus Cloacimonadota bacterium]